MKLNERVKNLLKEQMWYLATCDRAPNTVPVAFKDITEDGRLAVGDVFLETTLCNIQKNGSIAVSASSGRTLEGYQIKGSAEYVTEGPLGKRFKRQVEAMFQGAATAKGALLITLERVMGTTPGPDNKKEL